MRKYKMKNNGQYIAFDYLAIQPTIFSPFHGGGKYGKVILNKLLSIFPKIVLFYSEKAPHAEIENITQNNKDVVLANLDEKNTWGLIFASYNISCLYLPIPFSRLYKQYYKKFPKHLRVVGTIHGLRNLEAMPGLDAFRYKVPFKGKIKILAEFLKYHCLKYKWRAFQQWKNLIESKNYEYFVVSNFTRDAIKKILPNQSPCVFYSPSVVQNYDKIEKKENYFLLVSGNRWEKNNLFALRVLDGMFSKQMLPADFFVKITGVSSLDCFCFKFKNPEKFCCVGYVSEKEFSKLYIKAYALIYPSLSEGFGYPILEALAVETPVVASNVTSIPEIGGNAALYFNPKDPIDAERQIKKILDSNVYNLLRLNTISQYKKVFNRQQLDLQGAVNFITKN